MKRTLSRLAALVGRHKERALIHAVTGAKWNRNWSKLFKPEERNQIRQARSKDYTVLCFWGKGGIGKTRLLEEVEVILKTSKNHAAYRYGGFFDLYDTDLHDARTFEDRLIANLPGGEAHFAGYRTARKQFDFVEKTASGKLVEQARRDLIDAFVADFNQLTARFRLIICLDTIEVLQSETSVVEKIGGALENPVELKDWLLTIVPRLKNTVFILAGRPQPEIERMFKQSFGASFLDHEVSGFVNLKEAKEYFANVRRNPDADKALTKAQLDERVAYKYSSGEPLLLSMMVDLAVNGIAFPEYLNDSWTKAAQVSEADLEDIRKQIHKDLAEKALGWTQDEQGRKLAQALPYLAWARKGIDPQRIRLLLGWTMNQAHAFCKDLGNDETRPSFVKIRPKIQLIFLHDEMYSLVDQYIGDKEELRKTRADMCDKLIADYQSRISKGKGKEKQRLQLEQLYYKFLRDPYSGYLAFARMADDAVVGHENEFAASLETELLRFFPLNDEKAPIWARLAATPEQHLSPNRIKRGISIRHVKRLLAEERYPDAVSVAEKLLKTEWVTPDDPYYEWFIRASQGEGMAYVTPGDPRTLKLLEDTRAFLESHPDPKTERREYLRLGTLGRVYNDIGFVYARQQRLSDAVHAYQTALGYYGRVNLPRQRADTLRNLADILGRQGEFTEATERGAEALRESKDSGSGQGVGLTHNVLARIELGLDRPRNALDHAQQALRYLVQVKDRRAQGLVQIVMGQSYRKIVGNYALTMSRQKAEKYIQQSIEHLEIARDIFENQIPEPARLVEVYAQAGASRRDLVTFYRRHALRDAPVDEITRYAEEDFREAIRLAKKHKLVADAADAMNDQAELYLHAREFAKATHLLDQAEKLMKTRGSDFFITKGKPLPEINAPAISSFWQILGKNSLVRARIAGRQEKYEDALEQFFLAFLYFEKYYSDSPDSAIRPNVADELKELLRRLPTPRAEKLDQLSAFVARKADEYSAADQLVTTQLLYLIDIIQAKEIQ